MAWFIKWLAKELPAPPAHRCHFRRLRSQWAQNKLVYECRCGALYGLGHKGWRHVPPFDPSKSKY